MNNLQDIFVPYEESLELKKLGFDEDCLASSSPNYKCYIPSKGGIYKNSKDFKNSDYTVACPTFEQAFKFFRDKYKIEGYPVCIQFSSKRRKGYQYVIISNNYCAFQQLGDFNTYEEARLECLKHLIKIVKDGQ